MAQWLAVRAHLIEKEAIVRIVLVAWFLFGHVLDTAAAGEVLSGRVVGTDGRPIVGATVNALGREQPEEEAARRVEGRARTPLASVRTGPGGTFRVETAAPAIWLEARAEGRVPAMSMPAPEGATTLTLGAAGTRRGVVRGGGRPLAGALVLWTGSDGNEVFARTGADGSYEAPDPTEAPGRLAIYHPDFAVLWASASGAGELDQELQKGSEVAGVVVDAAGKPVPNATVWLDGQVPAGRSDAAGGFRIAHAPQGWRYLSARAGALAGAAPQRSGRMTVKVRPAVTLAGSVRDAATGQPLARVTVVATDEGLYDGAHADTDAHGNYAFKALRPGRYRVYAGIAGYVSGPADYATAQPLDLRSVAASRRDFALKALPRARGRVVDAEQRPVEGAQVALGFKSTPNIYGRWTSGPFGEATWTGPDGAFSVVLPDPEPARQGPFARDRLVVVKDGYAAVQVETSRMAAGPLLVVLPRGVEMSGRVTTAEGTPVAGVAVSAAEDGTFGGTMIPTYTLLASGEHAEGWTLTDASGRFSMRVHPVAHHLSFHKKGHAPKVVRGHDAASGEALSVVLDPAAAVRGRVVRADGRGITDVHLRLTDRSAMPSGSAQTSADGTFTIGDLAAGAYELTATHSELGIHETRGVEAPSSDVQIALAPRGTVRGRVVESASRQPVTRFTVAVTPGEDGRGARSLPIEDAGGGFSIDDVPLGTASLTVSAEGHATRRVEEVAVTADGEPPEVEVALDAEAALLGRVTGERGEPVAQAHVSVEGEGTPGAAATSDDEGAFELRGLTAGEVKLEVNAAGFVPDKRTVDTRVRNRVDVTLRKGLVLRGEVVADGAGVPQAGVSASSSARDAEDQNTQTDERGRFVLEGLVPGRYTVRASAQGMKQAKAEDVDVEKAGSLRLVLERTRTAVLSGKVLGLPPAGDETAVGMVVAISQDGGGAAVQAMIDAAHTFRMEDAPTGRVQVRAMWMTPNATTMRSSRPVELTLAAGAETETVLEFASDVAIKGVVVKGGSPVPGAMVSFAPTGRADFGTMGRTDARGAYEVVGLDPGPHKVSVYGNGVSYSMDYAVSGSAELDIDVTGGAVAGRVVRADTGAPVSGADVLFFLLGGRENSPTATRHHRRPGRLLPGIVARGPVPPDRVQGGFRAGAA